jgi:branched-chain amino acid transport system substrate-binding protein
MNVERAAGRSVVLLLALAVTAGACGNDDVGTGQGGSDTTSTTMATPGEPIVLGFINQEDTPAGSFPEVRLGAAAAVDYINAELGGVDGRPIELVTCKTQGTPESTQTCANRLVESDPVLVLVGEDFQMGSAYPIFEQAGLPVAGLLPVTPADFTSTIAHFFSGGSIASMLAIDKFVAEELEAERVAIIYQDDAAGTAALPLVTGPLDALGVQHSATGEKADAADFTPAVVAATDGDPDALVVLLGPQGCVGVMKARQSLGLELPIVTTGACYAEDVLASVGDAAHNTYFTGGADLDRPEDNPDVAIYREKLEQYASGTDYRGLATAGFSTVMTTYEVLAGLGPDAMDPASIAQALRDTQDGHLFLGDTWTCGTMAIFPAICSTGVTIFRYDEHGRTDVAGGAPFDGSELLG